MLFNQEIAKSKKQKTVQGQIQALTLSIRQMTVKEQRAKKQSDTDTSKIYAEVIISLKSSLQDIQKIQVSNTNTNMKGVSTNTQQENEDIAMESRIFNDYYSPALAKCWAQDEFLSALVTKHNIQVGTPEYTYAQSLSFSISWMDQQACKDINAIDEIREMTISIQGWDSVDVFLKKVSDKYWINGAPYKYATDWVSNKNYENPRYITSNGYFVDTWYDKNWRYNPPQDFRGAQLFTNRIQTGLKWLAQTQASIRGDVITTYNNFIEFWGTKQQFLDEIVSQSYFVWVYGYEFAQTLYFHLTKYKIRKWKNIKKRRKQKIGWWEVPKCIYSKSQKMTERSKKNISCRNPKTLLSKFI